MFDFLELDDGVKRVEYLWVRPGSISWWESNIDHPISSKRKTKIYHKQLEEVLLLLDLFLLEHLSVPDTCWKYNRAEREQSRRFLNCVKHALILLIQWVREPARKGAQLDLLLVNRRLVGDVVVRGHLGHRDHKRRAFYSQSCKEGDQQNCQNWCLGLPGGRLRPVYRTGE